MLNSGKRIINKILFGPLLGIVDKSSVYFKVKTVGTYGWVKNLK